MTASELLPLDLMDIVNESDESDQECFCLDSSVPFEELRREFDLAKYYRRISNYNVFNCADVSSRRRKTKFTQTEPEVGNIPPSWILVGEKLIEELYTGLGNVINTMYHTPNGCNIQGTNMQPLMDPKGMKYFTYENGYWQSTLLPNVKIPDHPDMHRKNRTLYSEDTKKKLNSLLEAATKLRNIIPYVIGQKHLDPQAVGDKSCSNETSTKELKRSNSSAGCTCFSKSSSHIYEKGIDTEISESKSDSGNSSECSPEYCNTAEHNVKRLKKESVTKHLIFDDSREVNQLPGASVSAYKPVQASRYTQLLETGVCKRSIHANYSKSGHLIDKISTSVVKSASTKVLAGCSNSQSKINKVQRNPIDVKTSKEKHPLIDQENCTKNKTRAGSSQKNFIRRNIMALRNTANHVGNSAARNDPGCSSSTHEANRNKGRVKFSGEIYEKYLR